MHVPPPRPPPVRLPFSVWVRTEGEARPIQKMDGFELAVEQLPWSGPGTKHRVSATWRGAAPTEAGLLVRKRTAGAPDDVLVPSLFYGDNGEGNAYTRYPRLGEPSRRNFTANA